MANAKVRVKSAPFEPVYVPELFNPTGDRYFNYLQNRIDYGFEGYSPSYSDLFNFEDKYGDVSRDEVEISVRVQQESHEQYQRNLWNDAFTRQRNNRFIGFDLTPSNGFRGDYRQNRSGNMPTPPLLKGDSYGATPFRVEKLLAIPSFNEATRIVANMNYDNNVFDLVDIPKKTLLLDQGFDPYGWYPGFGQQPTESPCIEMPDGSVLISTYAPPTYSDVSSTSKMTPLFKIKMDGKLDRSFGSMETEYYLDGQVRMMKKESNSIFVGGQFLIKSNDGNYTNQFSFIKMDLNGKFDMNFYNNLPQCDYSSITDFVILNDGKIVVCGDTTLQGESSYRRIIKLNSNGTLDSTFSIIQNALRIQDYKPAQLSVISSLETQMNEKFSSLQTANSIFDTDVTQDENGMYIPSEGSSYTQSQVDELVLQRDSLQSEYDALVTQSNLLIEERNTELSTINWHSEYQDPTSIEKLSDGSILCAFERYGSSSMLRKMNSDGIFDYSFMENNGDDKNIIQSTNYNTKIKQLSNGKIAIYGSFNFYSSFFSKSFSSILFINSNGTIECPNFSETRLNQGYNWDNVSGRIHSLQEINGKILVSGSTFICGPYQSIVKIGLDGIIDDEFANMRQGQPNEPSGYNLSEEISKRYAPGIIYYQSLELSNGKVLAIHNDSDWYGDRKGWVSGVCLFTTEDVIFKEIDPNYGKLSSDIDILYSFGVNSNNVWSFDDNFRNYLYGHSYDELNFNSAKEKLERSLTNPDYYPSLWTKTDMTKQRPIPGVYDYMIDRLEGRSLSEYYQANDLTFLNPITHEDQFPKVGNPGEVINWNGDLMIWDPNLMKWEYNDFLYEMINSIKSIDKMKTVREHGYTSKAFMWCGSYMPKFFIQRALETI